MSLRHVVQCSLMLGVVYGQGRSTIFRMPIYPMLNRWNANPITHNPGLWLVESCEYSYEYWWEHISYAYLSNVKSYEYWWAEYFRSRSSDALCVLGQAASDWSRAVNIVMNIDENIFRMPIYPMLNHMNIDELNISFNVKPRPLRSRSSHALLTVARWRLLFDRPPQGGAWYTCPVLIVRSSLDVYKPWCDWTGEIVVWGQICSCGVFCEIYF